MRGWQCHSHHSSDARRLRFSCCCSASAIISGRHPDQTRDILHRQKSSHSSPFRCSCSSFEFSYRTGRVRVGRRAEAKCDQTRPRSRSDFVFAVAAVKAGHDCEGGKKGHADDHRCTRMAANSRALPKATRRQTKIQPGSFPITSRSGIQGAWPDTSCLGMNPNHWDRLETACRCIDLILPPVGPLPVARQSP